MFEFCCQNPIFLPLSAVLRVVPTSETEVGARGEAVSLVDIAPKSDFLWLFWSCLHPCFKDPWLSSGSALIHSRACLSQNCRSWKRHLIQTPQLHLPGMNTWMTWNIVRTPGFTPARITNLSRLFYFGYFKNWNMVDLQR